MKLTDIKFKIILYTLLIVILMGGLAFRLAFVQLLDNDTYQSQAKENTIRLIPIKASRGEIFSQDNQLMATNKLVYTINLTYLEMGKNQTMIDNLCQAVSPYYPEITVDFINEKINSQKYRPYEPVTIIRDIPLELVVKLEENRQNLPGIVVNVEPLRSYPMGSLAGHVLGYIHQINSQEIESMEKNNIKYTIDSLIGKSGVEKQYEQILRGQDGARRLEVDAKGRPVSEFDTLEPLAGDNIYLTIDSSIQQVMEKSMDETLTMLQRTLPKAKVGSAVMMNVKTGAVLAMCSMPSLNPDDWKGNISTEKVEYYFPQTSVYDP
ncbi:MAG: penicillin-binding protein 2, partial [Syntrophomonadaceae bacterium]|nr:penicillin-binding protein 2 [Syntrophomonadaceae bacterium]